MPQELREWALSKLESVKDQPVVLVRDPQRLVPKKDQVLDQFAADNGYVLIIASTNLAFRELYERAREGGEAERFLIVNQEPASRRIKKSPTKAPPVFYPDLVMRAFERAMLDIDLRQYLIEATGEPSWPRKVNEPGYYALIIENIDSVLRAYENLRTAHPKRFNDSDLDTIVAYAALGIPDTAYKKELAESDYWKICLVAHDALERLDSVAPGITGQIKKKLKAAPEPFNWFAEYDSDVAIRAFYLAVILSQHTELWNFLMTQIDNTLLSFSEIKKQAIEKTAPRLVKRDPERADLDLAVVEDSLGSDALKAILVDAINLDSPEGYTRVIEREQYSILLRSLALLIALRDLLSGKPDGEVHGRIQKTLFESDGTGAFINTRQSEYWSNIADAYRLAFEIQKARQILKVELKTIKVLPLEKLDFGLFFQLWNEKRVNRLEYYLSALERTIESRPLLPRSVDDLPDLFDNAMLTIKQQVSSISKDIYNDLAVLNSKFQDMVARQYPEWAYGDTDVRLTSQFIRRCLKPNWDPEKEKAAIFIFDGMRYDIWDELLRPMLLDRMEVVSEYRASSLLPSETRITRKALSAGGYPAEVEFNRKENQLLQAALASEFGLKGDMREAPPEGAGVGETIRYAGKNLDVYIFELCDKELHGRRIKKLPDGREVPERPLSVIYEQHLKGIFSTEVMAIIRKLEPGTKVFITADHGFGQVGRAPIWFKDNELNELEDCKYQYCWLRVPVANLDMPKEVKRNLISFTPEQLRVPAVKSAKKGGDKKDMDFAEIVFPRTGFSFSRKGFPYKPDAYSHGGISIQELMIPMAVLQVKQKGGPGLNIDTITGPSQLVEGEEGEFKLIMTLQTPEGKPAEDIRVDMEASYGGKEEQVPLPKQTLFAGTKASEAVLRFTPETTIASSEERLGGNMDLTLTAAVSYRIGGRLVKRVRLFEFSVKLDPGKVVRRVPASFGNILGMTPKSMR